MKNIEIIKTKYGVRRRVHESFHEPSMTDQSQKEDCDINVIVARYKKTGDASMLRQRAGVYMDVSEIPSYGDMLTQINLARDAFESLPGKLRKRFGNDPQEFISFLQDTENNEEAYKLGLKIRPKPDPSTPLPTNPPEPKASKNAKASKQLNIPDTEE